jgi:hypothetical protein
VGVVREGWGQGGEMTQVLYAHMNNKKNKEKNKEVNVVVFKNAISLGSIRF